MGGDLLLNIVSEIIGMAITVFLVDKIIQKRENARWLPSKHLLYSRLNEVLNKLIYIVIPPELIETSYVYKFGDVTAYSANVDLDYIYPYIKQESWDLLEAYSKKLTRKKRVEKLERILQLGDDLNEIIDRSIILIEPELLSKLMELSDLLVEIRGVIENLKLQSKLPARLKDADSDAYHFAFKLFTIFGVAEKTKNWLELQATKKIAYDEFMDNLMKTQEKLEIEE